MPAARAVQGVWRLGQRLQFQVMMNRERESCMYFGGDALGSDRVRKGS